MSEHLVRSNVTDPPSALRAVSSALDELGAALDSAPRTATGDVDLSSRHDRENIEGFASKARAAFAIGLVRGFAGAIPSLSAPLDLPADGRSVGTVSPVTVGVVDDTPNAVPRTFHAASQFVTFTVSLEVGRGLVAADTRRRLDVFRGSLARLAEREAPDKVEDEQQDLPPRCTWSPKTAELVVDGASFSLGSRMQLVLDRLIEADGALVPWNDLREHAKGSRPEQRVDELLRRHPTLARVIGRERTGARLLVAVAHT